MAIATDSGWLGMLVAVWNADGLEAWTAKLIGVLLAVFAITALVSFMGGRGAAAKSSGGSRSGSKAATPFKVRSRTAPLKNRKKKQERLVRRYRPRSHSGTLRPLTRRVAANIRELPQPKQASSQPKQPLPQSKPLQPKLVSSSAKRATF